MDIRGGGQRKCEIHGVKGALSCQNANLTVMIMSHFKKRLSPAVIFISSWLYSHHTLSHKQEQALWASLQTVINKIVETSYLLQQPLRFLFVKLFCFCLHSVTSALHRCNLSVFLRIF